MRYGIAPSKRRRRPLAIGPPVEITGPQLPDSPAGFLESWRGYLLIMAG
jgi:hypothetical protein